MEKSQKFPSGGRPCRRAFSSFYLSQNQRKKLSKFMKIDYFLGVHDQIR